MKIISEILTDTEKLGLLAPLDMFDRVIDISFLVKDKEGNLETYVLRSDYEIDFAQFKQSNLDAVTVLGKGVIRKCTYKPSIKVSFTPVTGSLAVKCVLSIDNFYMISSDGKINKSPVASGYGITSIKLAMGYFSQFTKPNTVEEFYTLDEKSGMGITIVTIVPNEFTVDNTSPSSSLVITGYVGRTIDSPLTLVSPNEVPDYTELKAKQTSSDVKSILKEFITYRFVNYSSLDLSSKLTKDFSELRIFQIAMKMAEEAGTNYMDNIVCADFLAKHGVKVFLSEEAGKLEVTKKLTDASGNPVNCNTKIPFMGKTTVNTLSWLNRCFQWDLQAYPMTDGNLLIFRKSEIKDAEAFLKLSGQIKEEQAYYKDGIFSRFYGNKLPAVYSISKSVSQITVECPFFAFINLFEECEFKSVYGNMDFTLALTGTENVSKFFLISQKLDFATVDEVNEMVLSGVVEKEEGK